MTTVMPAMVVMLKGTYRWLTTLMTLNGYNHSFHERSVLRMAFRFHDLLLHRLQLKFDLGQKLRLHRLHRLRRLLNSQQV